MPNAMTSISNRPAMLCLRFLLTAVSALLISGLLNFGLLIFLILFVSDNWGGDDQSFCVILLLLNIVIGAASSFFASMAPWANTGRWACFIVHCGIWGYFLKIAPSGFSVAMNVIPSIGCLVSFYFGSAGDNRREKFWHDIIYEFATPAEHSCKICNREKELAQ